MPARQLIRRNVLDNGQFVDDLNTDTRSSYSEWGDGSGPFVWGGTTWTLPNSGAIGKRMARRTDWGTADDNDSVRIKGRVTAQTSAAGLIVGFAVADDDSYYAQLAGDGALSIRSGSYGNLTHREDLTTGLGALTVNHYYWLRLKRDGNNRTVTIYDTDGVTVLYTNTGAIDGAIQGSYGAGQALYPTLGERRSTTGGQDAEIDQFEFRP